MEGRSIYLRPFDEQDAEAMFAVLGDARVMRFSLTGVPKTREETRGFVKWAGDHHAKHGWGLLAVVVKDDERVAGYCGLMAQTLERGTFLEIGYRFNPVFWGRGLATEAAGLVRDDALGRLGQRKVISLIEPDNLASARVARRIGMRLDWEYDVTPGRPVQVYSIEKGG